MVIDVANRNNVTIKESVCLVNSICLAESLEFPKNDQDKVKHKRLLIKREYFKERCFRCKLIGHFKVNCTARIFYCKLCRQHHHKNVKCSDVEWVNGNFHDVKCLLGNRLSSSDYDVSNGKRSDMASCKDSSIKKEYQSDRAMAINWDILKNIPFIDNPSTNVISSSDLDRSYTPPLVNTDVEWWDWEEESICCASDSSNIRDSFAIDSNEDPFAFVDSDSGISSMNRCCSDNGIDFSSNIFDI